MASTSLPPYITNTFQIESISTTQGSEQQFLPSHYLVPTTVSSLFGYQNSCLSQQSSMFVNKEYQNRTFGCNFSKHCEVSNGQPSTGSVPSNHIFSGTASFQSSQQNYVNHGLHSQNDNHFQMDPFWSISLEKAFKERPELMCSTIRSVSSVLNLPPSVGGRKDGVNHSSILSHPQGSVSLDGMETIVNLDNAWRPIDGSTSFIANAAEVLWDSSLLPSTPGFSSRAARFSSTAKEGCCIQSAQPALLEERRESTLNKLLEVKSFSPVGPDEVQNIKEEVHNLAERWNGNIELDSDLKLKLGKDQDLLSSKMPNNLHDQRARMSQSPECIGDQVTQSESCDSSRKKSKITKDSQRPAAKDLLPTPKNSVEEVKKTEVDVLKRVKKCKTSPGEEGKDDDDTSKSLKRDQSCVSDNSTTCEKQVKETSQKQPVEVNIPPKQDYIHVRARRGQATDSHSLAERVRREKISERMKLLQSLVPNCNKVTGKALVLDEIISYVQSLQRQVEFLSMKLTTINPRPDFNMDNWLPGEVVSTNLTPASCNMVQIQEFLNMSQHPFTESPTGDHYLTAPVSTIRPQVTHVIRDGESNQGHIARWAFGN